MTKNIELPRPDVFATTVKIAPSDIARRRLAAWNGIRAESYEITRLQRFECGVTSPFHVLIVTERAERDEGETVVDGARKSTLRELSHKLTFVPAGRSFRGWQDPRILARGTYLYIDPNGPLLDPELRFSEIEFEPRLYFFDRDIWETAFKLRMQVENPGASNYAESLGLVLAHELVRLQHGTSAAPVLRGGLAGWQKRKVADYIEDHLNEDISLRDIAAVAQLSPFHFARAFKQTFGEPPHRYHMSRRMERAKTLLEIPDWSVTKVGMTLGFGETSSFTTAFRRTVGTTPSDYRRSIM